MSPKVTTADEHELLPEGNLYWLWGQLTCYASLASESKSLARNFLIYYYLDVLSDELYLVKLLGLSDPWLAFMGVKTFYFSGTDFSFWFLKMYFLPPLHIRQKSVLIPYFYFCSWVLTHRNVPFLSASGCILAFSLFFFLFLLYSSTFIEKKKKKKGVDLTEHISVTSILSDWDGSRPCYLTTRSLWLWCLWMWDWKDLSAHNANCFFLK